MAQIKSVRKKFFEVSVPLTAAKVHVYGHAVEQFENQVIKIDLTKSLRGKSLELRTKIHNNNGTLESTPISLELLGSYLRKAIRKGTNYVEDSFEIDCKDAHIRIKPFLLTRRRVSRAIRNELRKTAHKFIEGYCKVRSADEIFSDVTANKIQKELAYKLKKIYPLAFCEIRILEIVPEKKMTEAAKS